MSMQTTEAGRTGPGGSAFSPLIAPAVAQDFFWRWSGALWNVYLAGFASPDAVAATARARLAHLLRHARLYSPFWARRLRGLPDDAAPADLPSVTRAELMAHFDDWACDRAVTRAAADAFLADPARLGTPFLGRYALWTSSGTTGEPGIYVHDAQALATYDALELVRFRGLGPAQWMGAACLAGDRYALLAATGGHFAGHASAVRLARLNPWFAKSARVFSIMQPADRLEAELADFAPNIVATYPTVAGLLADDQAAGRLHLRLREIWTGGETLSAAARARIEAVFGCRVRDAYGASEFLPLAWDCGRGALHANADWVLIEPVDAQGRPCAPGQPSHTTLITNLANLAQPLIRYDIGDRVTLLDGRCACGSPFPALRVEGRADDVLAFRGAHGRSVKLLPLALATALEEEAGVYGFQLAQTGPATLELRLEPAIAQAPGAVERCRAALDRLLALHGLAHVRMHWAGDAPRRDARSGKLLRVCCDRGRGDRTKRSAAAA